MFAAGLAAAGFGSTATGTITSFTGHTFQVVAPTYSHISAFLGTGACVFDELQGVTVTGLAVDHLGNGALGVAPAGVLSGTFDSHFLHLNADTLPVGGFANGSVTFSGQIVGLAYRMATLNPSDFTMGLPVTMYDTGMGSDWFPSGRAAHLQFGYGTLNVSGSTLTFNLVNIGSGEWTDLRILTEPVPAPGSVGLLLLSAIGVGGRRRRV
jgi:hypothetical protein